MMKKPTVLLCPVCGGDKLYLTSVETYWRKRGTCVASSAVGAIDVSTDAVQYENPSSGGSGVWLMMECLSGEHHDEIALAISEHVDRVQMCWGEL